MLELKFDEVKINKMTLKTGFLFHRLLDKEAKILLLTNYENDNLVSSVSSGISTPSACPSFQYYETHS